MSGPKVIAKLDNRAENLQVSARAWAITFSGPKDVQYSCCTPSSLGCLSYRASNLSPRIAKFFQLFSSNSRLRSEKGAPVAFDANQVYHTPPKLHPAIYWTQAMISSFSRKSGLTEGPMALVALVLHPLGGLAEVIFILCEENGPRWILCSIDKLSR